MAFYNDARTAELRRLAAQGLSAGKIAKAQGTTRNTVLGKMQRLGIAGSVERDPVGSITKPRVVFAHVEPHSDERTPGGPLPPPPTDTPEPCAVTLIDAPPGACRWPVGEAPRDMADQLMCGRPALAGGPYCDAHQCRSTPTAIPHHKRRATERLVLRLAKANR